MGTVKDAADKAIADVERAEAKEDNQSRPRSARPTKVERPRGASFNQADEAKTDVERVEAKEDEALTSSAQQSER